MSRPASGINGTASPSAMTPYILGLRDASTADEKLMLIRRGAEALCDDRAAIDHLHDVAIDIHDLPIDPVMQALVDGISDGEKLRQAQADLDRQAIELDGKPALPKRRGLISQLLSTVALEKIEWLWPGRIAVGKLTLLGGKPGVGKSHVAAFLGAVGTPLRRG